MSFETSFFLQHFSSCFFHPSSVLAKGLDRVRISMQRVSQLSGAAMTDHSPFGTQQSYTAAAVAGGGTRLPTPPKGMATIDLHSNAVGLLDCFERKPEKNRASPGSTHRQSSVRSRSGPKDDSDSDATADDIQDAQADIHVPLQELASLPERISHDDNLITFTIRIEDEEEQLVAQRALNAFRTARNAVRHAMAGSAKEHGGPPSIPTAYRTFHYYQQRQSHLPMVTMMNSHGEEIRRRALQLTNPFVKSALATVTSRQVAAAPHRFLPFLEMFLTLLSPIDCATLTAQCMSQLPATPRS